MMKKILIILIILVSTFILFLTYNFLFVYHFKLNGEKEVKLNVNSKYNEQGIDIKYRGKKVKDYKIESDLNTSKIGTYHVRYKKGKKELDRIVEVVDMQSPDIELSGDEVINLTYKKEYKEPGYKAIDNYDGDITDKVIINNNIDNSKLGNYEVVYEIKDSSNNKSEKKRTINVIDDVKPSISFKSGLNTYAIIGSKIKLNDYKATDNYDGDITDKVKIDGKVNNKKENIYKIKYSVKDSSDNEILVTKSINVQEKNTQGIPVLMYHWFYDDTKGETATGANPHNFIAKSELIKQLKYVKENKYYFPTWQELSDYIDGKIDLPRKSVIFTDDDCVDSFFDIALPIFQQYEVPVTSFCITKKGRWKKFKKEKYLDFESHTDSMHVRSCSNWTGALMCSSYKSIYEDIKTSVSKVENANSFAYPYGHHSEDAIKALKANNIKLAFTVNFGRVKKGYDKYLLPRVRISKGTSLETFKNYIK